MIKKIIVTIFAIFLFTGAVQAQTNDLPEPGMLPGNPLYFLKTWSEGIGTFFTFGEEAKTERFIYLSEKRLAEVNELTNQGQTDLAEKAMLRYEKQFGFALAQMKKAEEKGLDIDELLIKVSEATYKHQYVLADVYEKVPEQAREAIQRAMEESIKGYEESLKEIPLQEREKIMETVQEKKQEAERKTEELREKGIFVPEIPQTDQILEKIPELSEDKVEINVEEIVDRIPNIQQGRP